VTAASAGAGGMPLWLVCAVAFAAILVVALYALLAPVARKQRQSKQARLDEVHRYRMLSVYSGLDLEAPPEQQAENAVTARALAIVDKIVRARGHRERLQFELERAGMRIRPEEWAALQLAVTVGAAVVVALLVGLFGVVIGGAAGWLGCRWYVRQKTNKRIAAFEAQLPDALQLLAGALRSGFALNQALGTVVREGLDPVSVELGRALQEVRLGADLETALEDVAARMRSYDMGLVVIAIRTAREVGGNLAEVLHTTMLTMRERVELHGHVRVLTAEGRFSAKVLVGLPLVVAAYLMIFKKGYLHPLYSSAAGIALLAAGVGLLVIGTLWLNRLTKIEV
jgi:Flp pilus assembly protein TadB